MLYVICLKADMTSLRLKQNWEEAPIMSFDSLASLLSLG